MTKRAMVLTLILILSLGLVFWFSGGRNPIKENFSVAPLLPPPSPQPVAPSPPPRPAQDPILMAQQQAQHQENLEAERQRLESLQQNLNSLKEQQAAQDQAAALTYPAKISENTTQIQNLSSLLQEHRLAEDDVNEAAMQSMSEQSNAARAVRDQLDQSIRFLEQDIQRNLELLNFRRGTPPSTPEQRDDLANLQNQINAQSQQLQELRLQRLNASAGVLDQARAISDQADQQKADILSNESAIRDQMNGLREEITRLQNERNQVRMSSMSLSQQIRQTEQLVTEEAQRVRELETSQNAQR